jgi:hypothetical protein
VVNFDFKSSNSFNQNGDRVSGKFSLATQGFAKCRDFHDTFLDVWNEINQHANRAFLEFLDKGFLMPTFRQQFLGVFGFFRVDMNPNNMSVDFLSFLGNVKHGNCDKVVLNVIWNVTIKEAFHSIMTRECQVHTKEITNQGSMIRFVPLSIKHSSSQVAASA